MMALTTSVAGPTEVLPVFCFREEAQMFLHLSALGDAWRARRTSAGEIVSLLRGTCSGVAGVALDPIPDFDPETPMRALFGKREFVSFLSGRQETGFSNGTRIERRPVGRVPARPARAV